MVCWVKEGPEFFTGFLHVSAQAQDITELHQAGRSLLESQVHKSNRLLSPAYVRYIRGRVCVSHIVPLKHGAPFSLPESTETEEWVNGPRCKPAIGIPGWFHHAHPSLCLAPHAVSRKENTRAVALKC